MLKASAAPFGLRLAAGDEIYLNNGAYNNLRLTLGPTTGFLAGEASFIFAAIFEGTNFTSSLSSLASMDYPA